MLCACAHSLIAKPDPAVAPAAKSHMPTAGYNQALTASTVGRLADCQLVVQTKWSHSCTTCLRPCIMVHAQNAFAAPAGSSACCIRTHMQTTGCLDAWKIGNTAAHAANKWPNKACVVWQDTLQATLLSSAGAVRWCMDSSNLKIPYHDQPPVQQPHGRAVRNL